MKTFAEYRTQYAELYKAVSDKHAMSSNQHQGHGIDHDATVAQLAAYIAPDDATAGKAWCAGMLHSLDHIISVQEAESATRSCAHSLTAFYDAEDTEEIIQAALRHSELNQDTQSLTQQVLMDADRLANLSATLPIRSGQFHPLIPAIELHYIEKMNPRSTYAQPKSVLDDLRTNLAEYLPQLRLPKAQALGAEYAERLRLLISWIQEEYAELGLSGIEL